MNNLNELEKQVAEKHPGFGTYMECMSRALVTGMISFGLAVSGTYFVQVSVKNRLPLEKKYFMPISLGLGAIVAWQVASKRTKNCQSGWMAVEEKYTYFTQTK